ncbi:MAG: hypothetical protein CMJ31_15150 [Phycisphaerae bacterium]|nr:hypothetical protein [Phycisphaerae bacterium]|tara:strand:- start:636 stop:950 length:315 start_codon:yes stop_codon:yes gene_type:complete
MNDITPNQAVAPHRGALVLVFGILSLVCCGPLGIAAWIMGHNDLAKIKTGRMDPEGKGTTQAGLICGIVGTCLFGIGALIGVIWVVFVLVIAGAAAASSGAGAP